MGLYYAKSYLQLKYPIYKYPAQASPTDSVCINESENRVMEVHAAFTHHLSIAREEQSSAKYEAAYYRTHAEYVRNPSAGRLAAFRKNEKAVLIYKKHREQVPNDLASVYDDYKNGRALETVVLRIGN
ncbi:MAG: hypothetical protein EOP06_01880 [Proteobacteria bacterium]|nr:MAG: hypothetical protein EOP06_01880 [Pseudomonadota bacterium]